MRGESRSEARGQGGAGPVIDMAEGLQSGPAKRLGLGRGQFKDGHGQATGDGAVLALGRHPAMTETGQGARRLRRPGEGDAGLQAHPPRQRDCGAGQTFLAAEQMGAAGDVQHQTVRFVQRRHRAEAAEGVPHPAQQGRIARLVMRPGVQMRNLRPRIRQRHAGRQPQRQGFAVQRGQAQGVGRLVDQGERTLRPRGRQPVDGQERKPGGQMPPVRRTTGFHDPTP